MSQSLLDKPVSGRLTVNSILALAGIAGPAILVITDLTAAFTDPGYNLIRHSISSLAWASLGWVQTIGFLAIGLLLEVFVAGFFFSVQGRRGFGFGIIILLCFGFGLLLIGAFHTDPAVGPHTIDGTIHGVVARSIFFLFPVAVALIAPSFKKDPAWRALFVYSIAAAISAMVLAISGAFVPSDSDWFGLYERILAADEIIWLEVTAIWLLRLSLKK